MTSASDPHKLLRWSLGANAIFSCVSGAAFVLLAARIAPFIGVEPPGIVVAVGANLLAFAAGLAYLATRAEVPLQAARVVVALDLAWVAGTGIVVALGLLSDAGNLAALAVGDVVLVLAGLQAWGVRRARGAGVAVPVATAAR